MTRRSQLRGIASDARLIGGLVITSLAALVVVPLALAVGAYGALAICEVLYALQR